ncbi:DNA-protecting protein DprA [Microbacteriaceae bacterium VKM Ac-2855]|nr:DNA-protecting protein DprA [Microbacteriaceae bacterium VKM Ac-2855]
MLASSDEKGAAEAAARAAWTSLAEPGDGVAHAVVDVLGAGPAFAAVVEGRPATEIAGDVAPDAVRAIAEGLERWRPRADRALLRRRLEVAHGLQATLLVPGDADWPDAVDDLGQHAPLALWLRGDRRSLRASRSTAIVGARASTGYGEHVAAELAAGLGERGVRIVSGAAFGIDAVAHRSALAVGGATVAFLAGGPDRLYPSAHTSMLERMMATPGCAVATELPPGSSPTRWRFLQRNRIIAAVATATVVVEAGARSGSLNTAGHAAAIGRPLGAVPGPVTSASSAGCHRLLREFDATCITGVDEALELIGGMQVQPALPDPGRDPLATRVQDALSVRTPRDTGELARATGLGPRDVLAALGMLLAEGRAERTEDGRWLISR